MARALHMQPIQDQLQAMEQMLADRKERLGHMAPITPVVEVPVEPLYTPAYACPTCKDIGMVMDEAAWERAGYRDGLMPCPDCGNSKQAERSRERCGLSSAELAWRLVGRAPNGFQALPANGDARKAAKRMIEHPRGWLTLWGLWGTGKTRLAKTIVAECLSHKVSAKYRTVTGVLDEMRATYDTESKQSLTDVASGLKTVKVLTLDEFESFKGTDWAMERLFDVLGYRYEQASDRATVLLTNRKVERGSQVIADAEYNGKIVDRMLDGRFAVVEVSGGTLRPHSRWAGEATE